MRKLLFILAVFAMVVAPLTVLASVTAVQQFEPGKVLMGFNSGTAVSEQHFIVSSVGAIDLRTVGIATHVLKVDVGKEQATVDKLLTNPSVRWASLNGYVHTADVPNTNIGILDTVPNDTNFDMLWGLKNTGQSINGHKGKVDADIEVTKVWNTTTGTNSVVVAVVDTGIDYNHPDLAPNIWTNPGGVLGCAAGTHGVNVIASYNAPCDPMDDFFHGTHVSGTIGAVGNNGQGVAGINWTTSIMGFKFLNSGGGGTWEDSIVAEHAVTLAKQAGVNIRVVNNSWGGSSRVQGLLDEIILQGQNDIVFVAAAGNNSQNIDNSKFYPASFNQDTTNMVVAAATDNNDKLASFSNFGKKNVDLGAPGVDVWSTELNGGYGFASGTSMASPHTVGTIALMLSMANYSVSEIKARISLTERDTNLKDKVRTTGRLNACWAVGVCHPAILRTPG